jgi:hypothetical protein
MISLNGVNHSALAGMSKLFKLQQPIRFEMPAGQAPSVEAGGNSTHALIASLAIKLAEIKQGTVQRDQNDDVGVDEKLGKKLKWQNFYESTDSDTKENLESKVADFLIRNSKNPSEILSAINNGTFKVRHGSEVGFSSDGYNKQIHFDSDGNYLGVTVSGFKDWANRDDYVEKDDGKLVSKADGRNASYGWINGVTYYATW